MKDVCENGADEGWRVQGVSGECGAVRWKAEVLSCGRKGQLLVWLGQEAEAARLGELVLAMPQGEGAKLLGAEGSPLLEALARRLAALVGRPVLVGGALALDARVAPALAKAILKGVAPDQVAQS